MPELLKGHWPPLGARMRIFNRQGQGCGAREFYRKFQFLVGSDIMQGTARGSYGEAQQAALLEAGIQQTFKADNGKGGNNVVRQLGLAWPQEWGLTGKKLYFASRHLQRPSTI